MRKLLAFVLFCAVFASSCKKGEVYDAEKQLAADEQIIKDFLTKNNLTAQRTPNGIYYIIQEPGTGNFQYSLNTTVKAKYVGRLLNGTQFDSSATGATFTLGRVIYGWQEGIPLIQKGGKIRLLIPSVFGYQNNSVGNIPPNSVLDFDVELLDVSNPQ